MRCLFSGDFRWLASLGSGGGFVVGGFGGGVRLYGGFLGLVISCGVSII